MSTYDAVTIHNLNNRAQRVKDRNQEFLEKINSQAIEKSLPVDLSISNGTFSIKWLGEKAVATPRVVRLPSKDFAIEYLFVVNKDENQLRLWEFYLIEDGRLFSSPNGKGNFADFNSENCRSEICKKTLSMMVTSGLFAPTDLGSG